MLSQVNRSDLGHGTNNEAEFLILKMAIDDLVEICRSRNLIPKGIAVEIFTDSTIVRNRVSGTKKDTEKSLRKLGRKYGPEAIEAAHRMSALAEKCTTPLALFESFKIHWHDREKSVEQFGH